MKAKKIFYLFFLSIIVNLLLICVPIFIDDPFQIFHQHWIRNKNSLVPDMRIQAAGIINNYKFDSIIIGTSMLENTSSIEASNKLGGKFINISMHGSDFYERSFVMRYALEKHNIKKILFSLDSKGLVHNKEMLQENTSCLYNESRMDDYKVYLNINNLTVSPDPNANLDRPNAWYNNLDIVQRYGGLNQWFKAKNNSQIQNAFKEISDVAKEVKKDKVPPQQNLEKRLIQAQVYLDSYILHFAKSHPETEFILILPPYSRLYYSMQAQYHKDDFEIYKAMVRYLVVKSHEYPNIKVFGWGNYSFVDNLANYKDPEHYEYKINSWMLGAIERNEGLLLTSNIDEYADVFTKKALAFNLVLFGKNIDDYLNTNK